MFQRYAVAVLLAVCAPLMAQAPAKVDFRRDVLPIFKTHCHECHGPAVQMNGFRLDRRRDAMRGGTIAMIGPGNAEGSRLYHKLTGNQFGPQMPPTGPLEPAQIEVIKRWIDQGAEWPDDVSGEQPVIPPNPRVASLTRALRSGDSAAFRKLLAADPKTVNERGPGGSTPLMYAALYGDAATVRLLLDKGADPNRRNDAGATALMWAADDLEKARLLIEHGADVNAKSEYGRTPLLIAVGQVGNSGVVELLLEHGASVKASSPGGRTNALLEALFAMDPQSIDLLLDHGADLKAAGPVALAFSMRANCRRCLDQLKDPGADAINLTMFLASPPSGPALAVKSLLDRGGNPNAKDPRGNSILALAAASGAFPVETIQALLERGADANAKSADGETALALAKRHGRTPVVNLLLRAGARDDSPADAAPEPKPAANVRAAVERALPLLQQTDTIFLKKSGCVSCHNNSLAAVTVATARESGFRVDEQQVRNHVNTIGPYLESWRERVLQNVGIPGDTDTIGYILLGLAAAKYPPDEATDAMAHFIRRQQLPDGHWRVLPTRPPIESSDIEVTAVATRALQVYAPQSRKVAYERAVRLAGAWLAEAQPAATEDRALQLMGLSWAGHSKDRLRKLALALIAEQRPDGGWAQTATLASDAYATGQALVALQQSGNCDAACKKGLDFLLKTQAEDGSWFVRRRAFALQPYFDAGFPYGRDQFIAAAATSWAATALAMSARR